MRRPFPAPPTPRRDPSPSTPGARAGRRAIGPGAVTRARPSGSSRGRRALAPSLAGLGRAGAVITGLLLGLLAGIELARAGRTWPPPRPRPEATLARPADAAAGRVHTEDARAERDGAGPDGVERDGAGPGQAGPTRRSLQAEIEAIDPRAWLARFGEVETRPRHGAR